MKRNLFIAGLCVVAVPILLVVSGPLLVRLGLLKTVFYIQNDDSGRIRIVRATVEPTSLPALQPGVAPPVSADALPVIIDTDMAPDDWMAILVLLQRPDVDVRAITVMGTGEAHCGPGVRNAFDLAMLAGRPEVPVACGRETPLEGDHAFPAAWCEQVDDLLGLALPRNPNPPAAESAVELLTRIVRESPRQVHLIAVGPLTNVAEALEGDPTFADNVVMDEEGPQSGRTAVSDSGHTMRVATFADQARFEALFLDALNGRAP